MFIFFQWKAPTMWKIGYLLNRCWPNVVYNSASGRKEGIFLSCCICLNTLEENSTDVIWDSKPRRGILYTVCNLLRALWPLWPGWSITGAKPFLRMIVSFFNENSIPQKKSILCITLSNYNGRNRIISVKFEYLFGFQYFSSMYCPVNEIKSTTSTILKTNDKNVFWKNCLLTFCGWSFWSGIRRGTRCRRERC